MPDIDKLYDKAEKYLQKQRFESALETYLEIYKYEPQDIELLVTVGDLLLRLNRTGEAQRFLSQLLDQYIKRNDSVKAVATCRKILKLAPQDVTIWTKLAGLLEKSQKTSEALEAYREVLEIQRKGGASAGTLDCLQHIVKLDPDNLETHIELAETATRLAQPKAATPAFLRAAQLARQAGMQDRWAELAVRAHSLDPAAEDASVAAAEVLLLKGQIAEIIPLVEPVYQRRPDDLVVVELLAQAYLRSGDYTKAEPLCWKLYAARPATTELLLMLAEGLVQTGAATRALEVARKLKQHLFQQGKRDDFLRTMEKIYAADESHVELLEELTNLYNELNKEDGLRRSLTRLFNLYLGEEKYKEAADTLERIVDVDPYGAGHLDRLLNLEGNIDPVWYKSIQARLQPPSTARSPAGTTTVAGSVQKAESLDDLILEGEMYYRYQLTAKLQETVAKINQLFPGTEERNPRLRELYDSTGFVPIPAKAQAAAPAPSAAPPAGTFGAGAASAQTVEDLRRIGAITADMFREATAQGVMQVGVNEIGRALNASRCWAALGTADRRPALMVEYSAPAAPSSDAAATLKIYATLMPQAATKPDGWSLEDVSQSPTLAPLRAEMATLGLRALLALPMFDREQIAGLLMMEQCDRTRAWTPGETVLLKAIATQMILGVNNSKLRRLVRSLAGTDEETGLLPRSSYLDCLLAEAQRAKEQMHPLTVCLLEPDNSAALVKMLGDAGVQRYLQQVSKALLASLRQNDIAIRYSPCSIAVVYPDTALEGGKVAVEKLRRALSQVKLDGATAPSFSASVCDVPLGPSFDAVDGVTEAINRLEAALEHAHKQGGGQLLVSKFAG
jgi:diguanylate cyclase (GGDEF)-like protein